MRGGPGILVGNGPEFPRDCGKKFLKNPTWVGAVLGGKGGIFMDFHGKMGILGGGRSPSRIHARNRSGPEDRWQNRREMRIRKKEFQEKWGKSGIFQNFSSQNDGIPRDLSRPGDVSHNFGATPAFFWDISSPFQDFSKPFWDISSLFLGKFPPFLRNSPPFWELFLDISHLFGTFPTTIPTFFWCFSHHSGDNSQHFLDNSHILGISFPFWGISRIIPIFFFESSPSFFVAFPTHFEPFPG